ncbi:MAG: xanthine dehydrogenase family protein subunit M [Burkholderiales bacterium]|nr:xanthine dehydrogenase family protein subunit M [Burkholderiales bacterium]
MYAFEYLRAGSVAEAGALLAKNPEAKLLAGGQTFIPTLKARLAQPSHVIDIGRIAELRGITVSGATVTIGAMTRHAEVAASAEVRAAIPALAALALEIGDQQVRNRGTLGGSVANNDPAADYPSAVLGLNATVITSRREIAADDYFQGMFSTALEDGEIIKAIRFPCPKRAAYCKFHHPASGYAMAGAFVADTGAGVRVAITGAGASGVFRWKAAETALAKSFSAAALDGLAVDEGTCIADLHAGADYRAHLAGVMTRRAVQKITG